MGFAECVLGLVVATVINMGETSAIEADAFKYKKRREEVFDGIEKGYYLDVFGDVAQDMWDDGSVRIMNWKIREKGVSFLGCHEGVYWRYDDSGKREVVPAIESSIYKQKPPPTEILQYGVYRAGWTAGKSTYIERKHKSLRRRHMVICALVFFWYIAETFGNYY